VRRLLIALLGALVLQLGLLQAAEAQDDTTTTAPPTTVGPTTTTTTAPPTTVAPTTTTTTTTPGPEFGVFDRQPASGPVRTVIAVNSVTPCVPPQGASNPEVDVLLFNQRDIDQNTDTAFEVFAIGADGTWSGKLTVPADAELGKYFLAAACFAGAEEEPFLDYEEQQFTVTAAPGAPPAVAVPGTPTVTG
jgi:hypothetical protein